MKFQHLSQCSAYIHPAPVIVGRLLRMCSPVMIFQWHVELQTYMTLLSEDILSTKWCFIGPTQWIYADGVVWLQKYMYRFHRDISVWHFKTTGDRHLQCFANSLGLSPLRITTDTSTSSSKIKCVKWEWTLRLINKPSWPVRYSLAYMTEPVLSSSCVQ